MRVIYEPERGQRVPVRLWARDANAETIRQLQRLASQRYVVEFVAGMADAHVSEGVAVGSVFATERTVVPRALGGDLGCGMSARRVADDARALDRRTLRRIVEALERAIPTGDSTHRGRGVAVPDALFESPLSTRTLDHTREALAPRHLGTLGGGNHFLELDRDTEGAYGSSSTPDHAGSAPPSPRTTPVPPRPAATTISRDSTSIRSKAPRTRVTFLGPSPSRERTAKRSSNAPSTCFTS